MPKGKCVRSWESGRVCGWEGLLAFSLGESSGILAGLGTWACKKSSPRERKARELVF